MKKQQILLIDDDVKYCQNLSQLARNFNFKIHTFHNLEDGINYLKTHQQLKAIILDERCILTPEQKPGTEKTNFVFHAMQELKDLEHEQDRVLPFCVNAAEPSNFNDDLIGIASVFQKNKDENELFKHLKLKVQYLKQSLVEKEFEDIFDFVDDYFNEDDYEILETLLLNKEKSDPQNIVTNLSLLRRIEEKLFDVLCINMLAKQPAQFDNSGRSRTKNIIHALYVQKIIPRILKDSAFQIYTLASRLGSHNPNTNNNSYLPSQYFVTALVFNLLEIMQWSKKKLE